jgi:hypothetical protein
MFRLFDALVEGRLLGGVSANKLLVGGGLDPNGPSELTIDLERGGGAAEAGRRGPFGAFVGSNLLNSDLNGGAVSGGAVA